MPKYSFPPSFPGVTGDGSTPGGLVVAGTLNAGDLNAASVPSYNQINGTVTFHEVPGNQIDGDGVVFIEQAQPLVANHPNAAVEMWREGVLNGHQYLQPIFKVFDTTATTAPLMSWVKQGTTQVQIDGDGLSVHGKFKTGGAVTHTLGAYSGKSVPIYDESGALLGYMPLYS